MCGFQKLLLPSSKNLHFISPANISVSGKPTPLDGRAAYTQLLPVVAYKNVGSMAKNIDTTRAPDEFLALEDMNSVIELVAINVKKPISINEICNSPMLIFIRTLVSPILCTELFKESVP